MDFGSSAATTWIGPTIARTAGTPYRWETATPRVPERVSERSRRPPTKRSASASSATPPLPTADSIATAAARYRLKRRPPSSIIDGPTHWDVGPWWNWQHVWLWTRRFQVRVLAGQSGQQHPAEGWPSGLRRRPAKALTRKSLVGSKSHPLRLRRKVWAARKSLVGSNRATEGSELGDRREPIPPPPPKKEGVDDLPPASPRRLPDGWPSGLRRTPGERVGSNPASWVRIPPRPFSSTPRGSMNALPGAGSNRASKASELDDPRSG